MKAQARRALEHQLAPSTAFAVRQFIAGPPVGNPITVIDIADRPDTSHPGRK
jgi:hypothetical protein